MKKTFLPKPQELLEIAFARGRKQTAGIKGKTKEETDKAISIRRIEVISNTLETKLEEAFTGFPSVQNLPPFQRELLEATVDIGKTKKALGHFTVTVKLIKKIRRQKKGQIIHFSRRESNKVYHATKEFFGRISSVVKKLGPSIEAYNEAMKKMNELPEIKEIPTVILAGFPNTGKTTTLARITDSKPEIAAYPFTTKKLQIGYFEEKYRNVQVIDTPGLLDRPLEERNQIEKKAIAAMKYLAKIIVFVIDPTETCGYKLEKQINLLKEIKKTFDLYIIVALNKSDIATRAQIEKAEEEAKKLADEILFEGEGKESALKESIWRKIKT